LTTWVLLAMVSEGAQGNTLQELQKVLALPPDKNVTYRGFEAIRSDIMVGSLNNRVRWKFTPMLSMCSESCRETR
jgi:hypothetical protein